MLTFVSLNSMLESNEGGEEEEGAIVSSAPDIDRHPCGQGVLGLTRLFSD
jgi:hypothetical protein